MLINGWYRERELQQQVINLAVCGVRPSMIRKTIGCGIGFSEIVRIFRLVTHLTPMQRRGRVIRPSYVERMPKALLSFYSRLVMEVKRCVDAGAEPADALAAAWRIEVSCQKDPTGKLMDGAKLEDLVVLYLGLKSDELTMSLCQDCSFPLLTYKKTPLVCNRCEKRMPAIRF